MRVFTLKAFARWARKEGVAEALLNTAVAEIESGKFDADLGGHVIKQRIARYGGGKSGGWRTILAFRSGDKAFFIYGFAKNERANITGQELKTLKAFAKDLLAFTDKQIGESLAEGIMKEVASDERIDP